MFNHLQDHGYSYYSHFLRATWIGGHMIVGGLLCMIHAFIPPLFTTASSDIIKKMYEEVR